MQQNPSLRFETAETYNMRHGLAADTAVIPPEIKGIDK
jgi:hypothetical protein